MKGRPGANWLIVAQACATSGIQPITGVEITLTHGLIDMQTGPVHLTLLAENEQGYANLCRLITLAHKRTRSWEPAATHLPADDPRPSALDPSELEEHTHGLIVLSGCRQAEIARCVDRERYAAAEQVAQRLTYLFGPENTYIELQHNLVQGDTRRVTRLAQLAERLNIPLVATGNVHYHVRSRHRLQDAMVDEVNWTRSVVQTIEIPAIQIPNVELPTIQFPTFQFSGQEAAAPPKLAPLRFAPSGALDLGGGSRRGRPWRGSKKTSSLGRAAEYGVDIALLRGGLRLSSGERLQRRAERFCGAIQSGHTRRRASDRTRHGRQRRRLADIHLDLEDVFEGAALDELHGQKGPAIG